MIKYVVAILLFGVFAASAAQAADDPKNMSGYGKTEWGMTPDEVLSAEAPRAEKLEKPENFKTGLGLISIKEVQIGVTKFSAIFIFDKSGKRLRQVNLTSLKKPWVDASSFSSIEKLLTEKYGAPTYKEERVVFWKLPKTSIELARLNILDILSRLEGRQPHPPDPVVLSQVTVSYKPSRTIDY